MPWKASSVVEERLLFVARLIEAEAVRLVLSTGRPNHVVADELGIGSSTLGKWVAAAKEADLLSGPHSDVTKELARLRKENEILRQERDILKNDPRPWARLRAVETGRAILPTGGERPFAYWWRLTPLKNVAHGRVRT